VFSLSWTLYFTSVDSYNYTLYSFASVFVWKRRFFLLFGLDCLHVSGEYGQRKRIFSKPLSRMEIFGNAVLLCSITSRCSGNQPGLMKTITSRSQIPRNAHASIKDGTVFNHHEIAFSLGLAKMLIKRTATYRRRSFRSAIKNSVFKQIGYVWTVTESVVGYSV